MTQSKVKSKVTLYVCGYEKCEYAHNKSESLRLHVQNHVDCHMNVQAHEYFCSICKYYSKICNAAKNHEITSHPTVPK
jgi:hypothetical protein